MSIMSTDSETPKNISKLMMSTYNYPQPDDPEYHKKIYTKREFYAHKIPSREKIKDYDDVKRVRNSICNRKFSLQEQQSFLANFINPETPYKGVLVAHGTGTGKTCAGVTIAERFVPMVQKYNTKIHILTSGPLIKENWKRELLKCTGETYLKKEDASVYISDEQKRRAENNAISVAMQYYKIMSYTSFYKKVLGEKIKEDVRTDGKTRKISKKTKDGLYERYVPVDKINSLDNTLIIIDEAHNLTGNSFGEALKKIIDNSKNLKVVLLTATPMKNLADDVIELINYLRPKDAPILREKVFTSDKNYKMNFKTGGVEYLKKMATGYVSFLRGADPLTFAKREEKGVIPKELFFTKLIRCEMSPFQKKIYLDVFSRDEDALDKTTEAVANFAFPTMTNDRRSVVAKWSKDGVDTMKTQIRGDAELLSKKIETDIFKQTPSDEVIVRVSDNGKSVSGRFLEMPYLKHFSIKFYKAVKKLNRLVIGKKGPKTAFIYSNLVKVGVELFAEILMQNGYLEFNEDANQYKIRPNTRCYLCGFSHQQHVDNDFRKTKSKKLSESSSEYEKPKSGSSMTPHKFSPATFVTVTGKSTEDENAFLPDEDKKRILDNVFNTIDNRYGKSIKFVLGSKVMTEGISLRHVSEVHILDAYYNLGKVDQIIGRAIRHCSHYGIIDDNNRYPKVKVYKYVVTLDNKLSGEEELYRKAELKYILVKKVERALKEVAVDCPLNRAGNVFLEEVEEFKDCVEPGSSKNKKQKTCPAICDYTGCDFKCDNKALNSLYWDPKKKIYKAVPKENIDRSTFTQSLARSEIDEVKAKIQDMFRLEYVYSLEDVLRTVKLGYSKDKLEMFDDFFVYKALDELVPITESDFNNFNSTIFDKFNRPGYLIYINRYYIYQPFDENEDVPMYYRSTQHRSMIKPLTMFNYLKNTVKTDIKLDTDDSLEDTAENKAKKSYDFDSVMDYYNSRKEYKYVGIIDKESSRHQTKKVLDDVFKLREKRGKMLDKKRGTGIQSFKGAVCSISYPKDYLAKVAKDLKIRVDATESRVRRCEAIKNRLMLLEKYSRSKDGNKMTYMMIPANHKVYQFPYNLEDRYKYTIDKIKEKIRFKLDVKVVSVKSEDDHLGKVTTYEIHIKNSKDLDSFKRLLESKGGKLVKDKWVFVIN